MIDRLLDLDDLSDTQWDEYNRDPYILEMVFQKLKHRPQKSYEEELIVSNLISFSQEENSDIDQKELSPRGLESLFDLWLVQRKKRGINHSYEYVVWQRPYRCDRPVNLKPEPL